MSWPSDEVLLKKIEGSRGLCGMGSSTIKTEGTELQSVMVAGRINVCEKFWMFKKLMPKPRFLSRSKGSERKSIFLWEGI